MKKKLIIITTLLLCVSMLMSSCSGSGDDVEETVNSESQTTPEIEDSEPTADLIDENFSGMEAKSEGGVDFTFEEEDGVAVLKQERKSFSDDVVPTNSGEKWDSASGKWVADSSVQTKIATYNVNFNRKFTGHNLVVNFKLKRAGGKQQIFTVRPTGLSTNDVGVTIGNDELSIGDGEMHVTTNKIKKTAVAEDEWIDVGIVYTLDNGRMGVMAVLKDKNGAVLASVALHKLAKVATSGLNGVDFVDRVDVNHADYKAASPANPTSVWYVKELTVQGDPLVTGDVISADRQVITTTTNVNMNFLSINGFMTIRPYVGNYAFLPDNSGFICGTADGSFYRYDFATDALTYLDRTGLWQNHLDDEFSTAERLPLVLNPETGNVFYTQFNKKGNVVLYKINPWTFEKTEVYEVTDKDMELAISPTYDEKYIAYQIGGVGNAGVKMEIGRINLETGEIDASQEITYNDQYAVNHVIINPKYPDLVLYHREKHIGKNVHDHTVVLNLKTGNRDVYYGKGSGEDTYHTLWVYGGEYISTSASSWVSTILTKDCKLVKELKLTYGNHTMTDGTATYVVGDHNGICVSNLNTKETKIIVRSGLLTGTQDPYDGHPEMSKDGTLISWGHLNANGVLGVGWVANPLKK